jgi:hypothetical protein
MFCIAVLTNFYMFILLNVFNFFWHFGILDIEKPLVFHPIVAVYLAHVP